MASCPADQDLTIHMLLARRNDFVPLSPRDSAAQEPARTFPLPVVGRVGCFLPFRPAPVNPKVLPCAVEVKRRPCVLAPRRRAPYRGAAFPLSAAKAPHGPPDRRLSPISRRGLAGRAG